MARARTEGTHSYAEYDVGRSFSSRSLSDRFTGGFDRIRRTDVRATHERLWSKAPAFCGVGFVALIAWILASVLKLAVPAKWTVLTWLLGAIGFVGKWVFFICAGIMILLYVVGLFFRFTNWLKNTRW